MNHQRASAPTEPVDASHVWTGTRHRLFVDSTTSYLLIIFAVMIGSYLYTLRSQSVFSCSAAGYNSDSYLAYCHATHYGDYDHGAFWFGLEPGIRDSVQGASVLFLGSSRMQFGFSSDATQNWFSTASTSHYLMGFAYWENYLFEGELLRQIKPVARVYVINLDTFFENTETAPAQILMHDGDALSRYQNKQDWQHIHAKVCTRLPIVCGTDQAFFRSRATGEYVLKGRGENRTFPTSYNETVDPEMVRNYTQRAKPFLASLPVDSKCVLLTMVPTVDTNIGTARAIASSLGATFIAPELEGLNTFDNSHMDRSSAERWSRAFFEAAGSRIRQCLATS